MKISGQRQKNSHEKDQCDSYVNSSHAEQKQVRTAFHIADNLFPALRLI